MKVLSLRQPWAWLVVHGGKRIENRKWDTRFRGEFLIHAAKGMTREEFSDAQHFASIVNPGIIIPPFASIERGGLVGRARLVKVHRPCTEPTLFFRPCDHPWHMPGQFGFVLEDVVPLPFEPMKGELGFFQDPRSAKDQPATRGDAQSTKGNGT